MGGFKTNVRKRLSEFHYLVIAFAVAFDTETQLNFSKQLLSEKACILKIHAAIPAPRPNLP